MLTRGLLDEAGNLAQGDIEDIGDRKTLKCPVHGYRFDVRTGEGIYQGMDGQVKTKG